MKENESEDEIQVLITHLLLFYRLVFPNKNKSRFLCSKQLQHLSQIPAHFSPPAAEGIAQQSLVSSIASFIWSPFKLLI